MLNRKLVEYTDISSKYVKVGVRYCVLCCFCCVCIDFSCDLSLSSLICFYVHIWFVTGASTRPSTSGVGCRSRRARYYHPNLPFFSSKFHK